MCRWLDIGFIVGIFFTALAVFYNGGTIIYLTLAVTLACGIGFYIFCRNQQ